MKKTIGMFVVADFAASAVGGAKSSQGCYPTADEIGCQRGQSIELAICPTIFDCDLLTGNIACFA
jgi:hypothetical protein